MYGTNAGITRNAVLAIVPPTLLSKPSASNGSHLFQVDPSTVSTSVICSNSLFVDFLLPKVS